MRGFDPARQFFEHCFAATDPAIETLFVAYLDRMACCIRLSRHDGDAHGVEWPLRTILVEAAHCNCVGLMVAHNHPSGDATPSASDRDMTRRLATATEAIDIVLLDHLVVGGDHVSSFRRMGLL